MRLQPDTLTLAAAVRGGGGRRFVSIAARPVVQAANLKLEFVGSSLGRLPVPRSMCALFLKHAAQSQATGSADHSSGRDVPSLLDGGLTLPALVTLSDDRRVELVQVIAGEAELIVTCRTLPRVDSASK